MDGRHRRNLDGASSGQRGGRDHPAAAILRIVGRGDVAEKNTSITHDCDDYRYYHGYRVAAPVLF